MQLQRQIDDLLAQRASEWLETLRTGSEAEHAAFIHWLSESRLHVQEFLEVVAVDRELDALDAERLEDVDALLARIAPNVTDLPQPGARLQPAALKQRWATIGIAAILAACAVAISLFVAHSGQSQEFATRVGEQRTLELLDASVVHLNADSQIEVHFGATERSIRLLHGEAWFKVAPDPARPFRVIARDATVQAIGTQFNVYDHPGGTRVSVLEGRVQVTNLAGGKQILAAGEEVRIAANGTLRKNAQTDVERTVAWRQRRLIFDNAPLEDMVREFNRYNASTQIELQGIEPGSHHYDGIFDADDPGSLAELLKREKDLTVETRERSIVIRAR